MHRGQNVCSQRKTLQFPLIPPGARGHIANKRTDVTLFVEMTTNTKFHHLPVMLFSRGAHWLWKVLFSPGCKSCSWLYKTELPPALEEGFQGKLLQADCGQ